MTVMFTLVVPLPTCQNKDRNANSACWLRAVSVLLTVYFGRPGAYFATDWRGATHQIMASLSGFLQGQTQINAPLPVGGLRPTAAAGRGLQPELRIHTVLRLCIAPPFR